MAVVLKGEATIAHPSNLVRRTFHFPLPLSFGLTLNCLACPAEGFFLGGGRGECGQEQAGATRKAARKIKTDLSLPLPFLHFPPDVWRSFTPLPIETADCGALYQSLDYKFQWWFPDRKHRTKPILYTSNYLERRPIDRRKNLSRSFHHGAGHMCYFLGMIVTRLG